MGKKFFIACQLLFKFIRAFGVFFIQLFYAIKMLISSAIYRKKVFILNAPIHGNLGDQAIISAEKSFITAIFKDTKIVEVSHNFCKYFPVIVKIMTKKSQICITGGGYLGDLWPKEDDVVKSILKQTKDKRVLFFPLTFCSENPEKYFNKSRKIYENCKELTMVGRDKYTYDVLKKNLANNILYAPDMVLYKNRKSYKKTDEIALCMRSDHEKTIDTKTEHELLSALKEYNYSILDTVIDKSIFPHNREKILDKLLHRIGESKLLITDRLHGMIFAYLTKTPCLVFNSKSPKVLGVYKWLEKSDYIILHNAKKNISNEIEDLYNKKYEFNESVTKEDFNEMKKVLLEAIK